MKFFVKVNMKFIFKTILVLGIFVKCCYPQRRIFNGFDAKPKQFPYVVNVRGIYYTCGGALFSER